MDNQEVMLIRIEEQLKFLTGLVSSHNERNSKEFNELWVELKDIRKEQAELSSKAVAAGISARIGQTLLSIVASTGIATAFHFWFK